MVHGGLKTAHILGGCRLRACSGQGRWRLGPSSLREPVSAGMVTDTDTFSRTYMGDLGFKKQALVGKSTLPLDYFQGGTPLSHMACGKLYSRFQLCRKLSQGNHIEQSLPHAIYSMAISFHLKSSALSINTEQKSRQIRESKAK